MKKGIFFRVLICFLSFGFCLFSYLEKQNELTELRIYAPKLAKEIKNIQEENTRLFYEIEQFESPDNMMKLARDSRFSHLRHPLSKEVLLLQEGLAIENHKSPAKVVYFEPKHTLAFGAK
ncbi:MAG: hypothetical protein EBZ47_05845 [Chlamydiae bacterium]|nr:hypothetical protein [Chlamydiota bacterium]